jgi:cation transport ATPase
MATRKQRRRRAKERRHEYVWEDEEGNELDPSEARESAPRRTRTAPRTGREPQEPSLQRTLKRAVIFAPIMFVAVMLLSGGLTIAQQVFQTLLLVGVFIPFSYFLDRVFWRSYQRKAARASRDG